MQEAAPATWPGNQWSRYGEPALQNAWEGSDTSQWQQETWPRGQTWWQQRTFGSTTKAAQTGLGVPLESSDTRRPQEAQKGPGSPATPSEPSWAGLERRAGPPLSCKGQAR
eukprot:4223604-Amphidinium_carterae.1